MVDAGPCQDLDESFFDHNKSDVSIEVTDANFIDPADDCDFLTSYLYISEFS
jgi:hypothetical protein